MEVINVGSDADSTSAVAGGLLGARDGDVAIPERWLERLEYRAAFANVASSISRRAGRHLRGRQRSGRNAGTPLATQPPWNAANSVRFALSEMHADLMASRK